MKLAVISLFPIVLYFAAELSSAQFNRRNYNYRVGRNSNIGKNGFNWRSNNGRHNANINYRNAGYNYRGNRWNTNINHGFRNRQTNLNANYRRNHNFRIGHNWRNGHTNAGYTWTFGKRRRSIEANDELLEFLKIGNEPSVFLKKLQTAVDMFVKSNQYTVPELKILSVSIPDQVTNVTVAEEIVCIVKKLQRILPKSLGNFIVKMIKFHGPSYNIEGLRDFFSVDPVQEFKSADDDGIEDACEVPERLVSSELVDAGKLLEMKKFVASLITVAMKYQQMLEE